MADDSMLVLEVCAPDADPRELDEATRQLRDEIERAADVAVTRPGVAAPPGAKSADAAIAGQLLLAAVGSGGIAVALVSVLKDWLFRHRGFRLRLRCGADEIEVSGLTSREFEALLPRIRSWAPDARVAVRD